MSNRYTVSIDAQTDATDDIEQTIREAGGTIARTLTPAADFAQVIAEWPESLDEDLIDQLRERPEVRYVEPVPDLRTDDPRDVTVEVDGGAASETEPYGIRQTGADQLHDQGVRAEGVTIGNIDTGTGPHEDLQVVGGGGYMGYSGYADNEGHGTHTGGTLNALDNDVGVIGEAPAADLRAYKVLGSDGSGKYADFAQAIFDACEYCQVLNMSLGGTSKSRALQDAVSYARSRDVLVVAAAGNAGADSVLWPAAADGAIAVAASTKNGAIADFSNRGDVDVCAPGTETLSCVPGGGYEHYQGTSMATPHVCGAAALLLGEGHDPDAVIEALRETATDLGAPKRAQGAGRIDVAAALDYLASRSDGEREGHLVALEGHGNGAIDYRVEAGTLWWSDARGASKQSNDTITGESPNMVATGRVTTGTDALGYWGTRTVHLERADGDQVTSKDVTVWVKPRGKEWVDWTDETLEDGSPPTPRDPPEDPDGMTPSMRERKERAAGRIPVSEVREIHTSQEFADAVEFAGRFEGDVAYAIADGVYRARDADKDGPQDAFHNTFVPERPSDSFTIVGNWRDPSQIRIKSNQAYLNYCYNEHLHFEGMHCDAMQLAGSSEPFVRNCVIEDRQSSDGALGGKPATGRFNGCVIGKEDDRFAATWYGQGHVYFDYDTEVRGGDEAYFKAPNDVTVLIRGSVNFSDPDKPLFSDGRSITPRDLHRGINELPPDPEAPVYQ